MIRPPASSAMPSILPSTCAGTPDSIRRGGVPRRSGQLARTRSWLPPMPPDVTITAWRPELEGAGRLPAAGGAALGAGGLQDLAADRVDAARAAAQAGDAVPEAQLDQAAGDTRPHPALEGGDQAGAGAPGDVEAGHGVAVPGRAVAAALGPADDREEPHALPVQPGALLARGEVDVRLGPLARPVVLGPVESGGALPVLPGQLVAVPDPQPALLGGVDQEEAAEGPVGLAADGLFGLLVEQDHLAAGVDQLRGGGEPGEARSDHDHISVVRHLSSPHRGAPDTPAAVVH